MVFLDDISARQHSKPSSNASMSSIFDVPGKKNNTPSPTVLTILPLMIFNNGSDSIDKCRIELAYFL